MYKRDVVSYGIIAYYKNINSEIKYLLIQRKDTIGYIDFLRAKYMSYLSKTERNYFIKNLIDEMTFDEKKRLLNDDFDTIWYELWNSKNSRIAIECYSSAKENFSNIDISSFINKDTILRDTKWCDREYGFPKGRRNNYETSLQCAMREFEEETSLTKDDYNIIDDKLFFIEKYLGSDGEQYKHIYFLAELKSDKLPIVTSDNNLMLRNEIKTIGLYKYTEAYNLLRVYHSAKRNILFKINKFLINNNR